MTEHFDRAFELVVGLEGGYTNDPRDPGGETKYGLSKRANPDLDIKNLTLDQAKAAYAERYWTPARCDELPWPLGLYVFDAAVNQGGGAEILMLQRAAGVAQDGILGVGTMKAITSADPDELCNLFMAIRALRYTGTRNFDIYGRGWFKRLFSVARVVL